MKTKNFCNYHGNVISSRSLKGLSLMESTFASNLQLSKHSHASGGFCLVLDGAYSETYGNTVLDCRPSYVKFQPAGEENSDRYGDKAVRGFIVQLESAWLDGLDANAALGTTPAVFQSNAMQWIMMRLRREARFTDNAAPLAIEGIVLELIAEASRRRPRGGRKVPEWLKTAKEFLDSEFSSAVTLSAVAEVVSVHPVYLAN